MNANTNINVLGGILDAMLANLVEMIDKRVEAKVITLTERIEALEKERADDLMEQQYRIKMFEKLEEHLSVQRPATTATLDLQSEEFRLAVIKVIDKHTMGDEFLNPLVEAITDSDKFNDKINEVAKEAADSAADEALDNHTSDYDHDDIHPVGEIDEDAVREVVDERLENVTITLKI